MSPPWNEGPPWVNSGSEDPHGGEFVCDVAWPHDTPENLDRSEANAEVIVRAVNEYEALRAVEESGGRLAFALANFLGIRELEEDDALIIRLRGRATEHYEALMAAARGRAVVRGEQLAREHGW